MPNKCFVSPHFDRVWKCGHSILHRFAQNEEVSLAVRLGILAPSVEMDRARIKGMAHAHFSDIAIHWMIFQLV